MADELYALNATDTARLRRMLLAFESGELSARPLNRSRNLYPTPIVWGYLTDACTGIGSLTADPSTGTLNIYRLTTTGGTTDTALNVGVYHWSPTAATTDRWTMAAQDVHGKYNIIYQACS